MGTDIVQLTELKRSKLVEKKATCPFLGSAIAVGRLPVRNSAQNPLASVQEVIDLGNTGGGDLGKVLGFFARGNHGRMRGATGILNKAVPEGLFSLDLPGSQGSHAGHSGILQGDPDQLDSGRFSEDDFRRLEAKSRDGFLKRSDLADFIGENVDRDPRSRSFPIRDLVRELADILEALSRRGLTLRTQDDTKETEIVQSLTKIAGSNNLVGSAGEFGLLLAFLHNSPRTRHEGADPAFSMDEITMMFRDTRLPEGWKTWKKTTRDWIVHTVKLALGAIF